ncbi:hypothetical protein [Rhodobacter maris]|uniref:Uncharacterized protein n=1 Tax=Rhodobacter maris TaxID=446682 RepID=A0A285SQG6_9RHOB|nr:hypothetical protein [Rhodobacter maris]SOC08259.1 hypothetical protein SAMN05877831_106180 [Rhodobacter maris]
MLRKIIALYRVSILIWCALILASTVLGGLAFVIEGATPQERWSGVGMILGGTFFTVFVAGSFALAFDNNAHLRKIAEGLEKD